MVRFGIKTLCLQMASSNVEYYQKQKDLQDFILDKYAIADFVNLNNKYSINKWLYNKIDKVKWDII